MIDARELALAGAALHDRFGVQVASRFGQSLPARVTGLAATWALDVGPVLDSGATSVVLAVTTTDGEPCVLKLSPDAPFLQRQVTMLERLGRTGRVPRVLRSGPGAVLMERIVPGTPLRGGDDLPTEHAWALLLHDLHGAGRESVPDSLGARCEEMFVRIGSRRAQPNVRAHVPDGTWATAVDLCRELVGARADQAVVHGDLHLGNVLTSTRRGLIAIDPKLCVGDRCFDMVGYVVAQGGTDEMSARARALARLTDVDTDRLLAWSAVNAVVTAVSRLARYGPEPRCDELLSFAAARIDASR